jgi:phenylpyruvate tautomerase PptA (4-oxalocrotonate tautomerase family)
MTHVAMRKGKPAHYRSAVLKGIHETLHKSLGVHPEAFFMTVNEYEDADFHANASYPFPRSRDQLLIQITLTAGRPAEEKQRFYQDLVAHLESAAGVQPADVFINLIEVPSENWSPGNGLGGRNPSIAAVAA